MKKQAHRQMGLDWAAKAHVCRSNRCHLPLLDGWSSARSTHPGHHRPARRARTQGTAGTSEPPTGALIESGDWAEKTTLMQLDHQHTPTHQLAAGKTANKLRETRCRILARRRQNRGRLGKLGNHHTPAPSTVDFVRVMERRGTATCSPSCAHSRIRLRLPFSQKKTPMPQAQLLPR